MPKTKLAMMARSHMIGPCAIGWALGSGRQERRMGTIAHVGGYTVDELAGSELDTDVDTRSHRGRVL